MVGFFYNIINTTFVTKNASNPQTGIVATQARAICLIVVRLTLFGFFVIIVHNTADDKIWVVLTGNHHADANHIVLAATSSAQAHCA